MGVLDADSPHTEPMSEFRYLNQACLNTLDPEEFQKRRPFPWVNPEAFLTAEAFRKLCGALPDVGQFDKIFGKKRKYGQQSHDRYSLDYRPDLEIDPCWHEFVAELQSKKCHRFYTRMFGVSKVNLAFHWHYTPKSCSVSPHCDARRKLGSHIFYFNTEQDWNRSWGGETLILESDRPIPTDSAPRLEDFNHVTASQTLGNRSLLFTRTNHSWHAVREIDCPPESLRKVFIMVAEAGGVASWWRRLLGRDGY